LSAATGPSPVLDEVRGRELKSSRPALRQVRPNAAPVREGGRRSHHLEQCAEDCAG